MMSAQRREELRKYMLEHRAASVLEMAQRFQVSGQTIRRDFEALESEGFLLRSYGGALLRDRETELSAGAAKAQLGEEKRAICRRAAALIRPNDCIFIDHSTTALGLCEELGQMPLTVVTNSHRVVSRLAGCGNIQLISTGGAYDSRIEGFTGLETVRYLRQHCMDKAFLSCRSVDCQRGVSDAQETIANVRQTVIENSDQVILLADHAKFGKSGFLTVCPLERLDYAVTDRTLPQEWRRLFEEKQVHLLEGDA